MSIEKLKTLNVDRILDMDEAVALSAYARNLESEYENLQMDPPEWLAKSAAILREEIERRTHAGDLAAMAALEREIDGYKTVNEKRTEASRRLADLKKKLGVTSKAGA